VCGDVVTPRRESATHDASVAAVLVGAASPSKARPVAQDHESSADARPEEGALLTGFHMLRRPWADRRQLTTEPGAAKPR